MQTVLGKKHLAMKMKESESWHILTQYFGNSRAKCCISRISPVTQQQWSAAFEGWCRDQSSKWGTATSNSQGTHVEFSSFFFNATIKETTQKGNFPIFQYWKCGWSTNKCKDSFWLKPTLISQTNFDPRLSPRYEAVKTKIESAAMGTKGYHSVHRRPTNMQ